MKPRWLLAVVVASLMAMSALAQERTDTSMLQGDSVEQLQLAPQKPLGLFPSPQKGTENVVPVERAALNAPPALAQQLAPYSGSASNGWRVTWVPTYIWFSGFSGTVGAGGQTATVDAGFWDLASHLNFAWATQLDVGKGRFGVVTDLQYIHLEDNRTFAPPPPPQLYSGVEVGSKVFIFDPEFYVRAVDTDRGSLDFLAGIRYWHLDNDIDLRAGLLPETRVSASDDWVDPILGFRFRVNLDQDKKWFLPAKADIGGFDAGSNYTWQVFAGIGRNFKLMGHSSALIVGYRKLFVDRTHDGKLMKVSLSGPIFGISMIFGQQ